jgi:hypothetical protein
MRAQEFIQENKQATAQQVLAYINQTHHEPMTEKLTTAVQAHPKWELQQVSLRNLNIPDQDYQDPEQEPESDPYNRVMAVDPDHANEYSTQVIDRHPIVVDDQGYIIDGNHRAWAAAELLNRDSIQAWVPVKQDMAEGSESYPEVLYHGSTQEIKGPLTPRQANDIGGAPGSNKNAIYATDDPNFAIAYSLAERGSDTGTFGWKKDPHLIFFGGKIRHGQNVYIHILPTRDEQGRPLFVRGAADAEWYSRPGVKEVTPTEVKPLPVDQYLHLLREPTPKEQKIFQANKAKQDMAENFADGKVKGKSRPGRVKRAGASCNGSVTDLRARAKRASGEKAKMYHWCANMKSGKKK